MLARTADLHPPATVPRSRLTLTMAIPGRGGAPGTPEGAVPGWPAAALNYDEVVIFSGAAWEDLEDWWLAVSREIQVQAFEAHPWHLAHEATHLAVT